MWIGFDFINQVFPVSYYLTKAVISMLKNILLIFCILFFNQQITTIPINSYYEISIHIQGLI